MKLSELKVCNHCRKPVLHSGVPIAYKITVQALGADTRAIQQMAGLQQILGGSVQLASVFAPDEEILKPIEDSAYVMACHPCMVERMHNLLEEDE